MSFSFKGQCTVYRTTALAASGVIHVGSGYILGIVGVNTAIGSQFIQLHFDSATVPANGEVPDWCIRVDGSSNFLLDLGELGDQFATGLTWSNSSTLATKTIGAADVWLQALYFPRR